jgi:hypothetical protein
MQPAALDGKKSVLLANCQNNIDVLALKINVSKQE